MKPIEIPIRDGGTYLIQGGSWWGRGPTIDAAVAAAKKAGGNFRQSTRFIVYWQGKTGADAPWIDAAGSLCYFCEGPPPEVLLRHGGAS